MYFEIKCEDTFQCEIIELQGELQNIECIDVKFDSKNVVLDFDKFYLQGKRLDKSFIVLERVDLQIKKIGDVKYIYLFDKPPVFKNI